MRWGLVPLWAKDPKVGYKMINARAETIADRPAFREPFESRRCLIPADGFYEWAKEGRVKAPYCFTLADDTTFAFAGIWDCWTNSQSAQLQTCSILTTSANLLVSSIHDRMPVILHKTSYDLWLDPGFRKIEPLLDLLKPYQPERMRSWRVSSRVNSVQNDDAACAEAFSPEQSPIQDSLFPNSL